MAQHTLYVGLVEPHEAQLFQIKTQLPLNWYVQAFQILQETR